MNKQVITKLAMSKTISIPKNIFEQIFFQNGGEKKEMYKDMTGQFIRELPEHAEDMANSEIEDGEYVKDTSGVKKAEGESHEQGGIKTNLEDGSRVLSNHLKVGGELAKKLTKEFEIKIKATDTYSQVLDKYLKKIGHTEATEEAEKYIKELDEQKQKVDDETTLALNQEILMDEIREYGEKLQELEQPKQEMFNLLYTAQEAVKKDKENKNGKFQYGGEQQKERLKDFYNQSVALGYEGDLNLKGDLGQEAGKLQKFMVANNPQAVVSYFKDSGQPMTAKGVDILKQSNPDAFKQLGLDVNRDSTNFTPEEKDALAKTVGVDDNFWLEQFQDNKWDWRYPMVASSETVKPEPSNISLTPTAPNLNLAKIPTEEEKATNIPKTEEGAKRLGMVLLPERDLLNPTFRAPLKFQPRIYSGERVEINPEQALSEINRSRMATENQIDQLPDAQKAATLSSMDANNAQAVSKIIAETSRYNAQARERESYEDAQVKTRQSLADAQSAAQYQSLMGRELEGYEADLQNQSNIRFQDNFQKWMYINQLNRNNVLNPDISYDGSTYQVINTPQIQKPITLKKGGKFNKNRFGN